MKTMKIKKEFFQKICGKIEDITFSRTVGYKSENKINIETTTYFLGFKIKHISLKNIEIKDPALVEAAKIIGPTNTPKGRTIVKGFNK
jgi:hypothetical protein